MSDDDRILSCGHKPSPHLDCTTGTARRSDGSEICYSCADAETREAMKTNDRVVLYLDGLQLKTWPGTTLARVTSRAERKRITPSGARHTLVYLQATDLDGKHWFGTSPGDHMYALLRAKKGNR